MFENIFEQRLVSHRIPIVGISGKVVDDTEDFTVSVAVPPPPPPPPEEGELAITKIEKPSSFTVGERFDVKVHIKNNGGEDYFFTRIIDRDTGTTLDEQRVHLLRGDTWTVTHRITLTREVDFRGRVEAGHEE